MRNRQVIPRRVGINVSSSTKIDLRNTQFKALNSPPSKGDEVYVRIFTSKVVRKKLIRVPTYALLEVISYKDGSGGSLFLAKQGYTQIYQNGGLFHYSKDLFLKR